MSVPDHNDTPRDPLVDAAWRAHSTELPPPHVDAAILAAAHREAHAKPRAVGDDDALAEAREPSRAWWGLAAAATIGAIAFGILQLAPNEAPDVPHVASDVPAGASSSAMEPKAIAPPQAATKNADAGAAMGANGPQAASGEPAGVRAARAKPEAAAASRAEADIARARESETQPKLRAEQFATTPPSGPTGASEQRERSAASTEIVPRQSFAPSPPPVARSEPLAEKPGDAATAPSAPPVPQSDPLPQKQSAPATAPSAPPVAAQRASPAPASPPAAPLAGAARRDEAARMQDARKAEAPLALRAALTPDAWVQRIVALFDAGDREAAERELRAFRKEYRDADERVPASLRAWAASVRRE